MEKGLSQVEVIQVFTQNEKGLFLSEYKVFVYIEKLYLNVYLVSWGLKYRKVQLYLKSHLFNALAILFLNKMWELTNSLMGFSHVC